MVSRESSRNTAPSINFELTNHANQELRLDQPRSALSLPTAALSFPHKSHLSASLLGVMLATFNSGSVTSVAKAQHDTVPQNPSTELLPGDPLRPNEDTNSGSNYESKHRANLRSEIWNIASGQLPKPDVEASQDKIAAISPLIAELRGSLNNPSHPPSFAELEAARNLISTPLNSAMFATVPPKEIAVPFVTQNVLDFYGELLRLSDKLDANTLGLERDVIAFKNSIFTDIVWCSNHRNTDISHHAVKILSNEFLKGEGASAHRLYHAITATWVLCDSRNLHHQEIAALFALNNFDRISRDYKTSITTVVAEGKGLTKAEFALLTSIPSNLLEDLHAIKRWAELKNHDVPDGLEALKIRVHQEIYATLREELGVLWGSTYRTDVMIFDTVVAGEYLSYLPPSQERALHFPRADLATNALLATCDGMEGCRVHLGNSFYDGLTRLSRKLSEGGQGRLRIPLSQLVLATIKLAPEPSRKQFIVDAMRSSIEGKKDVTLASKVGEDVYPSDEVNIGALTALLLLNDYTYCSTSKCDEQAARLSNQQLRSLLTSPSSIESGPNAASPAQRLVVDLIKVVRGGASSESVKWYCEKTRQEQLRIQQKSQDALEQLVRVIREVQPFGINSTRKPEFHFISVPSRNNSTTLQPPEPKRLEHFQSSILWYSDIADVICENFVDRYNSNNSEQKEIEHLLHLTNLLIERGSVKALGGVEDCEMLRRVRRRYADLSEPDTGGPFFACRSGLVTLLSKTPYRAEVGGGPIPNEKKEHAKQHDKALGVILSRGSSKEEVADRYARLSEAHFCTRFALDVLGDPSFPDKRPLPSMRGLDESSAGRRAQELLDLYHFTSQNSKLREIASGSSHDVRKELSSYQVLLQVELRRLLQVILTSRGNMD